MKDPPDRPPLIERMWQTSSPEGSDRMQGGDDLDPAKAATALKSVLLNAVGQLLQSYAQTGQNLNSVEPDHPSIASTTPAFDRPRIHLIPDCLPEARGAPDVLIPDLRPGGKLP